MPINIEDFHKKGLSKYISKDRLLITRNTMRALQMLIPEKNKMELTYFESNINLLDELIKDLEDE